MLVGRFSSAVYHTTTTDMSSGYILNHHNTSACMFDGTFLLCHHNNTTNMFGGMILTPSLTAEMSILANKGHYYAIIIV